MRNAFLSVVTISMLLAGCAQGTEPNDTTLEGQEDVAYPIDVNQNPNWHNLREDRADLGDDQSKFRATVNMVEGVEPGMVIIIGNDAWVNASFTKNFSTKEKKEIRNELKKSLIKAMPRYDLHLNLE
ncbi:hypothetical protein CIB95_11130 [Lottiidibacillus patelloidae]|uniref:Sporulation protein n=1 Tax=Lottiidibacillus patelloidae TaxID=2670334 RepID=A0A263BSU0_9BACI|nr:hypothetical protein [Lottiidibacillus patelloidae]OZM56765.1 hypothetical protein CIB95_11130 [Lottiidibacillus patelloidae]